MRTPNYQALDDVGFGDDRLTKEEAHKRNLALFEEFRRYAKEQGALPAKSFPGDYEHKLRMLKAFHDRDAYKSDRQRTG